MTISLAAFVAKYSGSAPVRSAHGLGGQCVDLAELYAAEVFGDLAPYGLPGNAIDFFGERAAPGGYRWVHNNPSDLSQVPPRGALMIWGASPAVGTGAFGHVDIVLDATGSYFNGFDQNWPIGAGPHVVRHSYVGVIGWGYPQLWDAEPIPILPQQPPAALPTPPSSTPPSVPVPAPNPTPAPPPPARDPLPPNVINPPLVSPPPLPQEVPPVPSNPPVPDVVPPEEPEPPVVAEQGVTTSEWKLVLGYLAQAAAVGTADLVNLVGQQLFHASVAIPGPQLQLIVDLEFAGGVAVIGYAVSRGIRKLGAR